MADQDSYIDELDAAGALAGTEQVPLFQSDLTVQATLNAIQAWLKSKGYMPRVEVVAPGANVTPNADTTDVIEIDGQNTNVTFNAPTGSPVQGQRLLIRLLDDGTPRTITFNTAYRFSSSLAAPVTTTANMTMYLEFIWNIRDTVWDCVHYLDNFS